jgi:hypothetical protein
MSATEGGSQGPPKSKGKVRKGESWGPEIPRARRVILSAAHMTPTPAAPHTDPQQLLRVPAWLQLRPEPDGQCQLCQGGPAAR